MNVPMTADVEHAHHADMGEPIKCAVAFKPTKAERHKREMVRHLVVVIALLAVLLLIAIAFYYTEGNSVTVKHINSLAAHHHPFARLS
jgi:hypothetical protein